MTNDVAASGAEPGAAIFVSVFFMKIGFVAVGTEQDVRHPVRRSAHLLTDHIQVNIRAAFDDQLIMNVTDDKAIFCKYFLEKVADKNGECCISILEKVANAM